MRSRAVGVILGKVRVGRKELPKLVRFWKREKNVASNSHKQMKLSQPEVGRHDANVTQGDAPRGAWWEMRYSITYGQV